MNPLHPEQDGDQQRELVRPGTLSFRSKFLIFGITIGVATIIVALVAYAPLIAAIVFIVCLAMASLIIGKVFGFRSGLKHFIKELFFGW